MDPSTQKAADCAMTSAILAVCPLHHRHASAEAEKARGQLVPREAPQRSMASEPRCVTVQHPSNSLSGNFTQNAALHSKSTPNIHLICHGVAYYVGLCYYSTAVQIHRLDVEKGKLEKPCSSMCYVTSARCGCDRMFGGLKMNGSSL